MARKQVGRNFAVRRRKGGDPHGSEPEVLSTLSELDNACFHDLGQRFFIATQLVSDFLTFIRVIAEMKSTRGSRVDGSWRAIARASSPNSTRHCSILFQDQLWLRRAFARRRAEERVGHQLSSRAMSAKAYKACADGRTH